MAATHPQPPYEAPHEAPPSPGSCLDSDALGSRLEEEISRASRQGGLLGCLLVRIEDLDETIRAGQPEQETNCNGHRAGTHQVSDEDGPESEDRLAELAERALRYASVALRRQLRRYDRVGQPGPGELLVLLPGVDGIKGERIARRSLERLRALKVEIEGERRPLRLAIGIAAWQEGLSGSELLRSVRIIAASRMSDDSSAGPRGPEI